MNGPKVQSWIVKRVTPNIVPLIFFMTIVGRILAFDLRWKAVVYHCGLPASWNL